MEAHVDYLEFVARLRHLVRDGASVTLSIVTDDRHFVNIGLKEGQIVSVRHGPRRGAKALRLVMELSGGGMSLLPAQDLNPQPDLPSTQEILRLLGEREAGGKQDREGRQNQDLGEAPSTVGARATAAAEAVPSTTAFGDWDLVQPLFAMEEALRRMIGPIAKLVMKEALHDLGQIRCHDDLARLAETLAREIDDPDQAKRFLDQVLNRG